MTMGEGWEGDPIEIIPGTPEDVAGLRAALISMVSGGQSNRATPYGGRLTAPVDPMQAQGASMVSNLMGKGNYIPTDRRPSDMGWGATALNARSNNSTTNPIIPGPGNPGPQPPPPPGDPWPGGPPPIVQPPPGGRDDPPPNVGTQGMPGNFMQQLAMLNAMRKNRTFGTGR